MMMASDDFRRLSKVGRLVRPTCLGIEVVTKLDQSKIGQYARDCTVIEWEQGVFAILDGCGFDSQKNLWKNVRPQKNTAITILDLSPLSLAHLLLSYISYSFLFTYWIASLKTLLSLES